MKIYGGRAGYNSVSYTGERYQSISRFNKGKITTEIRLKRKKRIPNILSKFPFIRFFSLVLELIIEHWKIFLYMVIALFLMEFLFNGTANAYLSHTIHFRTVEVLILFLIVASLIIKISPIARYHAAEHQIATAHEKKISLTIENVRKQPRTHEFCGTNLAVTILICYAFLFFLYGGSAFTVLISWAIGYELWLGKPKFIWSVILVIGKIAQYLLFTSKPKEKHLMVAMEAIEKLEEKELAHK